MKKKKNKFDMRPLISISIFSFLFFSFAFHALVPAKANSAKDLVVARLIAIDEGKDSGMAIVISGQLNKDRLDLISSMPYFELKKKIGTELDFAIYFVDENESLIPIGNKSCLGSERASVAGKSCG